MILLARPLDNSRQDLPLRRSGLRRMSGISLERPLLVTHSEHLGSVQSLWFAGLIQKEYAGLDKLSLSVFGTMDGC